MTSSSLVWRCKLAHNPAENILCNTYSSLSKNTAEQIIYMETGCSLVNHALYVYIGTWLATMTSFSAHIVSFDFCKHSCNCKLCNNADSFILPSYYFSGHITTVSFQLGGCNTIFQYTKWAVQFMLCTYN